MGFESNLPKFLTINVSNMVNTKLRYFCQNTVSLYKTNSKALN
jgi:hypothetical protein